MAQIAGGRADQAGELAERPMGRCDGLIAAGHDECQSFGIVAAGLDPDLAGFNGAGGRALGAGLHRSMKFGQREEALVVGARELFGRDAADALAA